MQKTQMSKARKFGLVSLLVASLPILAGQTFGQSWPVGPGPSATAQHASAQQLKDYAASLAAHGKYFDAKQAMAQADMMENMARTSEMQEAAQLTGEEVGKQMVNNQQQEQSRNQPAGENANIEGLNSKMSLLLNEYERLCKDYNSDVETGNNAANKRNYRQAYVYCDNARMTSLEIITALKTLRDFSRDQVAAVDPKTSQRLFDFCDMHNKEVTSKTAVTIRKEVIYLCASLPDYRGLIDEEIVGVIAEKYGTSRETIIRFNDLKFPKEEQARIYIPSKPDLEKLNQLEEEYARVDNPEKSKKSSIERYYTNNPYGL